jgi:hypothetical protein
MIAKTNIAGKVNLRDNNVEGIIESCCGVNLGAITGFFIGICYSL